MNQVHPSAVIGRDVELGDGNVIGPYTVIPGRVVMGDDNWIGPHVVIGAPAEIRGVDHGSAIGAPGKGIRLGSRNVVREFTSVHQGHRSETAIGDDCYVMNSVYVAHDNLLADGVVIAAGAKLGGHVRIGAAANLGMGAVVHHRRVIGPLAMVGMGSVVTRDVWPYALVYGNPARVRGANRVGLQRAGFAEDVIERCHAAYIATQADEGASTVPAGLIATSDRNWWDAVTGPRGIQD